MGGSDAMTRPFGKALGRDAMSHAAIYHMPDMARKAYVSLTGKPPICGVRMEWDDPPCEQLATAWFKDDEEWFHVLCDKHIDLRNTDDLPPVADVPPPTDIDTSRFGKHYVGKYIPWLRERRKTGAPKWRDIPTTAWRAHRYLFGGVPWCCGSGSAEYWLGRDEFSGEDKWDYACQECVNDSY